MDILGWVGRELKASFVLPEIETLFLFVLPQELFNSSMH